MFPSGRKFDAAQQAKFFARERIRTQVLFNSRREGQSWDLLASVRENMRNWTARIKGMRHVYIMAPDLTVNGMEGKARKAGCNLQWVPRFRCH